MCAMPWCRLRGRVGNCVVLKASGILDKEHHHGYGIMKSLKKGLGTRPSLGMLYPVLRRIGAMDFVSARGSVSVVGRSVVLFE